ncbi:MAG: FAD-dependent oxidoreductase [Asticcacaulis sp.]
MAKTESVLVVGSGPSGLECARALAKRGIAVTIAEREREAGGRVRLEAKLPGLSTYKRVADYRLQQLRQMQNVEFYLDSDMTAGNIAELGMDHVVLATGSRWRLDGMGRKSRVPIPGVAEARVHSPDAILRGDLPAGEVLIYDDDHYYMGGVLAELLTRAGCQVTLVTPAPLVSNWTENTLEQGPHPVAAGRAWRRYPL